jgi:beta-galactosidase
MGRNDKGMVTWDRKNFKDAYYFYRANWTDTPTLRLVGTRMTAVTNDTATVLGFSNLGDVTLKVNGNAVGTLTPDEVKTVLWRDVPLAEGPNRIELESGGRTASATWNR